MCGDLRPDDAGSDVVLTGWVANVRNHGGVLFVDVRDREGIVQVVAHPQEEPEAFAAAQDLRAEYVVRLTGRCRLRPEGTANPSLATGGVEVAASAIQVLSASDTPPFPVEDRVHADEGLRLK